MNEPYPKGRPGAAPRSIFDPRALKGGVCLCMLLALALWLAARPARTSSAAPPPAPGQITLTAGNYIGPSTTETYTVAIQVFESGDCTGAGGAVATVQHVGAATPHTFALGGAQSALVTIDPDSPPPGGAQTEQNGNFVAWFPSPGSPTPVSAPGDGRAICIQGVESPGAYEYAALLYAGIQYFDSCGNERYEFRPGEQVTIKVSGALKTSGEPHRLLVAGGSVNECTWVPEAPDFTTVHIDSDPFFYTFTLPDSDADIPASCLASNSTHITGMWRAVAYDVPGCGCNRADVRFQVLDGPPPAGCPLDCPADITVDNDAGSCGAVVNYTPPSGSGVTCDHPSGSTFPVGTTTVTCSGPGGSSCDFDVTVNDAQNPSVTPPADLSVSNDAGSCSAAISPGSATANDNCAIDTIVGVRSDSQPLGAPYPVGTTTITWTATDIHGNSASATQTVTVNDTQGPSLTGASASPVSLWPPNHKMKDVTVSYNAADNCGGAVTCVISGVTSNEPVNGAGDGNTAPDWQIVNNHLVRLRAERAGGGAGRVYTITVSCTDTHGNQSSTTVTVTVPHN